MRLLQIRTPSTHQHSLALLLRNEKNIIITPEPNSIKDHLLTDNDTSNAPAAYRKVLRLLREADRSGLWPLSSVARQKVMIPGTEVQVPKVQDVVAEVKSNGGENSDNLHDNNNDSNNIGNSDIRSDSKSAKNYSNGQNKKKGKYSHKDNDEKDKEKDSNGTISDNKKKKRKKFVIYTENPAVRTEENAFIETRIVKEADIGILISDESKSLYVIMSDENNHLNITDNSNLLITTEELKKNEKEKNNTSVKKFDDLKLEIMEEKIRAEERKKEGFEKLKKEFVLNSQKEEEEQERNEEEIELSRKGGRGTFSVGCLPKPLNCPKGNTLFPGPYLTHNHTTRFVNFNFLTSYNIFISLFHLVTVSFSPPNCSLPFHSHSLPSL